VKDIINADYTIHDDAHAQRRHENPLLLLHRHLRGRYRWACLLGILLAIPLAVGGYFAVDPMYASTGIVRIAPTITTIKFDLPDAKVPPLFESMVAAQASIIRSRRVIDLAMRDEKLRAAGWPDGPDGVALLQKNLDVSNRPAVELITASVRSKRPDLAKEATNAVLRAYDRVYEESNSVNATSREQALRDLQLKQTNEIDAMRNDLRNLSRKYATDDLEDLHADKIAEINKLSREIQAFEFAIRSRSTEPVVGPEPIVDQQKDTLEALATEDDILRGLIEDERRVQTQLDALLLKHTEEHRDVRKVRTNLTSIHSQVEARAATVRNLPRQSDGRPPNVTAMSTDELKTRLDALLPLKQQLTKEAEEVQQDKRMIADIKEQLEAKKKDLEDTTRTLDQIRFESRALSVGRMSILQWGDPPIEPSTDRRAALAVLGGMTGLGLGGGIMLLVGFIKGGYRFIDDVERSEAHVPLLGTVPDLSDGGVEQEQMAALSVHHLRNMLQLQFGAGPGGKVFTVTSSSSGDGKTSLAIALAMSFAATGRRTIIVDTDLVGRGLTRQLNLVDLPGLCESFHHDKLNGEVHQTKVQSLWAIPSGDTKDFVPEHLSGEMIASLIKQLRAGYDAIILDTGPILGSLEANVVAPVSDGVVLVISRGQSAKMVRASIERLRRLGATCSGLIFNRAGARDFQRSVSTASVSARSIQASAPGRQASSRARAALLRALEAPENEPAEHS
jgi:polysaccharide biosynthesis transport protein